MRRLLTARIVSHNSLVSVQAHAHSTHSQSHYNHPFPYPSHISNPTPHQIFHLPLCASQEEIKTRYFDLVRLHHPDSFHIRSFSPPISPDIAHARFRAIKASYDFLSGKTLSPHPNARPNRSSHFDPYIHELAKRRRAYYNTTHAHGRTFNDNESTDYRDSKTGWADGFGAPKDQQTEWNQDGWKERVVLSFGVIALLAGLFPSLPYTLLSLFVPLPSSSNIPDTSRSVFPDMYKNHREAASALAQVRQETNEVGVERRNEMRRRAREMATDEEESKGKID